MRNLLFVTTLFLTVFLLIGCEDTPAEEEHDTHDTLDIYYMNDLHGALTPDEGGMGMARAGNFLIDEKEQNPDSTLILAGGDMLQGTLISNHFYGENTTKIMDKVGFDAAAVGNHEFDWGLEKVTRYYTDNADAYQAEHDFLAANIVYEGTDTIPEGIEPYAMYERSGLNIGIIGAIGYGLESSILAPMVEDCEFKDPVPIAEEKAEYLRSEKGADIVLLLTHAGPDDLNTRVSFFEEEARIDAIFNGHTHQERIDYLGDMPAIESGSNAELIGHVQFTLEDGEIQNAVANNLDENDDSRFDTPHPDVTAIIDDYRQEIDHLFDPVTQADGNQERWHLADWMARIMKKSTDADVGIHNYGGTRDNISDGDDLSIAKLYDIFPFDNTVVTSEAPGHIIQDLMDSNNYAAKVDIDPDETYKIATNNYIFHNERNSLEALSENIIHKEFEMFELAVGILDWKADTYGRFDTTDAIDLGYYDTWFDPEDPLEIE